MLEIRKATIADLDRLLFWQDQPHVKAGVPEDDDWNWAYELPRNPDWRELLIAEVDGHPIGFIQIIDPAREESHYWGEVEAHLRALDIWIGEVDYVGQGFGTKMMALAIERCFAENRVKGILIDPMETNPRAIKFYERLGFKFLEKRRLLDEDCLVYFLSRKDWQEGQ